MQAGAKCDNTYGYLSAAQHILAPTSDLQTTQFYFSLRHDVPMVIPHVYAETSKCWLGVACVLDKDKYERPSCSRTNGCAGRRRDNMVDIMEDGKPERYMCWNLCLSVSEGGVQKQIIGRLCYTREIYVRCVIRYATSYTH